MGRVRVPYHHLAILNGGEDMTRINDYAFDEAGARAGLPLDDQAGGDLRWALKATNAGFSTQQHDGRIRAVYLDSAAH